ncbi:hypothetical protein GALL_98390 [mine drainage metagenome]|uniref:Lipoprotein n=1 Tax=mine drainage metagenome TaxID=410659 RepID=A0A1J5SV90_9ZZZZ
MRRTLPSLALLAALAACGPVPHPFQHQAPNPLVQDRRALSALSIAPVPGLPGLAEEMVKTLELEDIPATTHAPGGGELRLSGRPLPSGVVAWSLTRPNGADAGAISTPIPPGHWSSATRHELAVRAAADISLCLRGPGSGDSDMERRPHVALAPLMAPQSFDADALYHAMDRALTRQQFLVGADHPVAVVQGLVRITPPPPAMKNGQDMLEVIWVVKTPEGRELGRVSQGNPVDPALLSGFLGPLGRDIADAAAPGIAEVLHHLPPVTER